MRRIAIAIAVENYVDSQIPSVKFAAADATEFAHVLEQHGFAPADQLILINSQATKSVIQSKLRNLIAGMVAEDVLYIYYAGHGFALNNRNFITCHDTLLDDLSGTSITVEYLFKQFRLSKCRKIALFLDSCEAGLLAASHVRGIDSDLAEDEMKAFFVDAEHRICFAACKPGQQSRSHELLKHGVWTYHLIQAFNGDAPLALEGKTTLLTASSLQNFLQVEIPRSVRNLFTGTETQTPCSYGVAGGDFLIGDVGPILDKRNITADPTPQQLKYVRLLNDQGRPVKLLSGFTKGHFVPDRVNDASEAFVSKIAETEMETEVDEIHQKLKDAFHFKRRDITASVDGGSGSIITPYFDYELLVSLNPKDPREAIFHRRVINIREPDQVFSDQFDNVFMGTFDRLEFGTSESLDLELVVDEIEALDSEEITVKHNKEMTQCLIELRDHNFSIEITKETFCLIQVGRKSPKSLIQSFFDVQTLFINKLELKTLPFRQLNSVTPD
jgi:hypothetical protein